MAKRPITVLINDNYPDTANPLIYVVEVEDPKNEGEVMDAVDAERRADLGFDDDEELDLTLLLAFEGDLNPVADWRY